jgi:hypothetical protein
VEAWSDDAIKTNVFMPHAEKPEGGLGQLNCQGLNRALALPSVIEKAFGRPDIIMVPKPSGLKEDEVRITTSDPWPPLSRPRSHLACPWT